MAGGVVSNPYTVWLHTLLLPQPSVALQVRVAVKLPPQPPFVTVLSTARVGVPSHASVAVGGSKDHTAVHSLVRGGAQVSTGGVVSVSVTTWLQLRLAPQASVKLQVRVATKVLPQAPLTLVTVLRMLKEAAPQVPLV
jgi:hypothetical protein